MSRDVSFDQLPIAARFTRIERTLSNESVTSEHRHQQNTSSGHPDTSMADSAIAGLSHSQDPSSGSSQPRTTSTARIRHHLKRASPSPPRELHKPKSAVPESVLAPPTLPDDLNVVLEVVGDQLLPLHDALSLRLRERYTEQYPLVRNLADVFAEAVRPRCCNFAHAAVLDRRALRDLHHAPRKCAAGRRGRARDGQPASVARRQEQAVRRQGRAQAGQADHGALTSS